MSYLNHLRLVFSGQFQADVSTVNNDVRHFDNATFEERFQKLQQRPVENGWWNPIGSGAFRLINCRVTSVHYQDGNSTADPKVDSAIGLLIDGSNDRVSGKLVDIDPQWQLASEIWGLTVRLNDGKNPNIVTGQYQPAAFRDLWFSRLQSQSGDAAASATFQSVLNQLVWAENVPDSRFFQELKAVTQDGLLSIRLSTFGYNGTYGSDTFTIGTVVGAIGAYYHEEPHSFNLGRRIAPNPKDIKQEGPTRDAVSDVTDDGISFFDCRTDEKTRSVFADLSNALPLDDPLGSLKDIGDLQLAVFSKASQNTSEKDKVSKNNGDFIPLGAYIPYRDQGWLLQTSGIFSVMNLPKEIFSLVLQSPLALIKMTDSNNGVVAIRETTKGFLIRAEKFVHRVEPGEKVETTLYAAQYGKPLANAKVHFTLEPRLQGLGIGDPTSPQQPKADIPDINYPRVTGSKPVVDFKPISTTNAAGKTTLSVTTQNPGNPRKYLDGQLYLIDYKLEVQPDGEQHSYDNIVILLHDAYQVPDQPTWYDHIQPIFQQYGNLYPIMSQRLVNLGDYESVKEHRTILELAFSLDIGNPNFMPVTRDLSRPKQQTILKWLRQKLPNGSYALVKGKEPTPKVAEVSDVVAVEPPSEQSVNIGNIEESDGKTQFYRGLKAARKASQNQP